MIRSSDFPDRDSEFDLATDDMAQSDIEDGCDWRPVVHWFGRRDWEQLKRGEPVQSWARAA